MIGGENTSEPTNPTDSLRAILWESCLDITAGSFAGVWSCLSGHSFDTVKVNMQVTNNTLRQTVSAIYREYGLLGYFRGIYYPLVTIPLINAVCFASYEMANRLLQLNNQFTQGVYAGAVGGAAASFVVSPVQNIKCKMQVAETGKYKSSVDCFRRTLKEQGFRNGIMRGVVATMFKEIPSYAAMFAVYESMLGVYQRLHKREENLPVEKVCSGILSGIACTLVSHPQDVVKTYIQLQKFGDVKKGLDGGFSETWRRLRAEEGWRVFWRGLTPQLMRQSIITTVVFISYAFAKEQMLKV